MESNPGDFPGFKRLRAAANSSGPKGSEILWPTGVGLPKVGQLFVDELGGLAITSLVCPVLHQLEGDGMYRDGAQAGVGSRPASMFVDGSPCLALECEKSMKLTGSSHSLVLVLF